MKNTIFCAVALFTLMVMGSSITFAGDILCAEQDAACREIAKLSAADQFDKVLEMVDGKKTYSEASRSYIGQAYLMLAGKQVNTPGQEELFCLKALEYGVTSAYMGLYFINAGQDTEKALGFLKQYVATKPKDSVPYVLLGEAEMNKGNYKAADEYLREAKSVARGHSTNLDWMLFQVNYLLGDLTYASTMLDGALTQGQFVNELKTLAADPRFADLGRRPEFRKYEPLIKRTFAKAAI